MFQIVFEYWNYVQLEAKFDNLVLQTMVGTKRELQGSMPSRQLELF